MGPEIAVIVASIAFGVVILLAKPRVESLARSKAGRIAETGRAFASSVKDLLTPWSVALLLYGLALVALFLDRDAVRNGLFHLLLAVGVVLVFLAFWVRELLVLMALRDDELPGRFDKPIWALLLIALPPVGLVAFRCHRAAKFRPEPGPLAKPKSPIDYGRELI